MDLPFLSPFLSSQKMLAQAASGVLAYLEIPQRWPLLDPATKLPNMLWGCLQSPKPSLILDTSSIDHRPHLLHLSFLYKHHFPSAPSPPLLPHLLLSPPPPILLLLFPDHGWGGGVGGMPSISSCSHQPILHVCMLVFLLLVIS